MRMKHLFVSLALTVSAFAAHAQSTAISGAGASFPQPIYAKWAQLYKATSKVNVGYQAIGSGAGIRAIKAREVDFGASDMPLSVQELDAAGLLQFPVVMGGVAPVVNLDGVAPGQLRLNGAVLADIYLGRINRWNAPQIAALNPGLRLPDLAIAVVYRDDSSGTSFLWTDYLSKSSAPWRDRVGAGSSVKWATGSGAQGSDGVAAAVQRTRGSIGYVEWAHAKKARLKHVQLQNRSGAFVQPGDDGFKAAAAGANWTGTPGFAVTLTDQAGEAAWPVTGASYILVHKTQDAATGVEVLKFFDWAYGNGASSAAAMDYVPMPAVVAMLMKDAWRTHLKDTNGRRLW